MDWNRNLQMRPGFTSRDLGDEVVLLNEEGTEIHSLTDTGLWVWKRIDEGQSPEEILKGLVDEYDVEQDRAREDLKLFFSDLMEKGILTGA